MMSSAAIAPSFTVPLPPQIEAVEGDIVTFQVQVSGHPDPQVDWFHCGELIRNCPGRWEVQSHPEGWHQMTVCHLNQDDEGEYECQAQNIHGNASTFADLYYFNHEYSQCDREDDDSSGQGRMDESDPLDGKQSGLLILIDDGSQTDEEYDGPSQRRSMTASEQMQGIIEDWTQDEESLTLGMANEFDTDYEIPERKTPSSYEAWQTPLASGQSRGLISPISLTSRRSSALSEDCSWYSCSTGGDSSNKNVPAFPASNMGSSKSHASPPMSPTSEFEDSFYPALSSANNSQWDSSSQCSIMSNPDTPTCQSPCDLIPCDPDEEVIMNSGTNSQKSGSSNEEIGIVPSIPLDNGSISKITNQPEELVLINRKEIVLEGPAQISVSVACPITLVEIHKAPANTLEPLETVVDIDVSSTLSAPEENLSSSEIPAKILSVQPPGKQVAFEATQTSDSNKMSFSRSSISSSSYKYSSDVGSVEDTLAKTSIKSTSRIVDSSVSSSSSVRRSVTTEADEGSVFRRSSRTSTLDEDDFDIGRKSIRTRMEDDMDSGVGSLRRTSRLSSKDDDDVLGDLRPSSLLTRMGSKDDPAGGFKMSSRTSSQEDEDGVSVRRSSRMSASKSEDENSSFSKSKISSSLDMDDGQSSLSVRANKSSMAYENQEVSETGSSSIRSSIKKSSFAKSESFSSSTTSSSEVATSQNVYEAIIDFEPLSSDNEAIPLKEGQQVEVLDENSKPRRWYVRTRPYQDRPGGIEGWVPSCYLEKVSKSSTSVKVTEVTKEYADPKEAEDASKRAAVVKELVETEEDFSRDTQYVVCKYLREMESPRLPVELKDHKKLLFGNFEAISDFHNNELIKGVQYYANEPGKLGVTFLRLERDFDKHVKYCQNEPRAQEILASTKLKDYFQEFGKKIDDDKSLSDHLKLPIQRINDYQLLLKELIKYTGRLQEDTTDLERALEFMQAIPQKASDAQFINSIQGYKGNLHKFGRMLCHDSFEVTESGASTSKEQYLFLFKGRLCMTEVKKNSKDQDTYFMKNVIKLQDLKVLEDSDRRTLLIEHPDSSESIFPLKLKARTSTQRESWLKELTEVAIPHVSESDTTGKPRIRKALRGVTCNQGETTTLECETVSATSVSWLKENMPLKSSKRVEIITNGNYHSLILKDLRPEDAAIYTLVASNPVGNSACSATLNIRTASSLGVVKGDSRPTTPGGSMIPHAPVFRVKLKDTELLEGTSVRFELVVRGQPEPEITFFKDDVELKLDHHVKVTYESKEVFELLIDHISEKDAGKYSITAVNDHGKDSTEGNISVTKHKLLFQGIEDYDFEQINSPSPVPVAFKWFRDGQEFEASERFQVSFDDSEDTLALVFHHVRPDDAGLYTCVASTSSGKIACSAELTVQGLVNQLLRDPEIPSISASLVDQEVSEGASAMLELKVLGYPKPELKWYHNNESVEAGGRYKFLYEDAESTTLVIKGVTKADAGLFRVVASNDLGSAESSAKLTVTCPPSFKKQLKDTSVMTDEALQLEVGVQGTPTPDIKWFKDGQTVLEGKGVSLGKCESEEETTFILNIAKAKPESAGNYSCVVSNAHGSQTGFSNVTVTAPPTFVKGLKNVESLEEETLSMSVKVAGSPKPEIKWSKDGVTIKENDRTRLIEEEAGNYTLKVEKIKQNDSGVYKCTIKNDFGSQTTEGELSIKCKPSFSKSLTDMEFRDGDTDVCLEIRASGTPKPSIKWLFNNKEISENKNVKIISEPESGSYSLKIKEISASNAGEYTCQASNSVGNITTKGNVTVNASAKILDGLKDVAIGKDQDASFTVKFKGNPKPEVKWCKDEASLTIDGTKVSLVEEGSDQLTLIIHKASPSDQAKYSVQVKNVFGSDESSAQLKLKEETSAPRFTKMLKDTQIKAGEDTELTVVVEGTPSPEIKWLYEGKEVIEEKKTIIRKDDATSGTYSLQLKNVKSSTEGKYTCEASNSAGKSDSSAAVKILAEDGSPPTFLKHMADVLAITGDAARFEVQVSGKPQPLIQWFKGKEEISSSSRIIISSDSNEHSLTLKDLSLADASKFSCKASNSKGEIEEAAELTVKEPVAPELLGLSDLVVALGGSAKFSVVAKGLPSPTVSWLTNGKAISASSNLVLTSDEKTGSHNLLINKVKGEDVGDYICRAVNSAGKDEKTATLSIQKDKKTDTSPSFGQGLPPKTSINEDEPLVLVAQVNGSPLPEIQWLKEGKPVKEGKNIKMELSPDGKATLTISDAKPSDAGKYEIVAKNPAGETKSASNVEVQPATKKSKPKFVKELQPTDLVEGKPAELEVKATGNPTPKLTWMKNGEALTGKEIGIRVESEPDGSSKLIIESPLPEDAGKYSCFASNDVGDVTSVAPVTVKRPPSQKPEFSQGLKPADLKEGETARLEAKVTGEPKPTIKWMKDGQELTPDNHCTITEEPDGTVALILENVKPEDAGKYALTVSNDQGEATSKAPVIVNPLAKPIEKEQPKPEEPKSPAIPKPEFDQPLMPVLLKEGDTGKLEARLVEPVKPENVTWLKDGKPILPSNNLKSTILPDGTLILTLEKVGTEDSGKYSVIVTNPGGEAKSEAKVTTIPKMVTSPGKKPEFEKGLEPLKELTEGEPLRLKAKLAPGQEPVPTIKWLKDGEDIVPSNRLYLTEEPEGLVVLSVDHALPDDSGKYAVVASNPEGKTRSPCMVEVKAIPKKKPEITSGLKPTALTAGQPGTLNAKMSGNPKPAIKWLKDGHNIDPDSHIKIIDDADGSGSTLSIDSVVPQDAGKYTVVAANENGESRSSAPITVNQPPVFKQPLTPANAVEGYPSKMEALLTGEPVPELKWLKDGKNFKPDGHHVKTLQTPEGHISVLFDHCIPQDAANYCCVATNPYGEASSDADLKVIDSSSNVGKPETAPVLVTPLNDIEVKEGEPIKLEAQIEGFPLPSIQWLLDGQPIYPSDNIHQTFDGKKASLEVCKSNPQHAGKYECKAVNTLGDVSSICQVKVVEKSAPKFIQRLVDLDAPSTEPLSLQCKVIGYPQPNIVWSFNGTPLEPGLKYNMAQEEGKCSLTLAHPRAKDKGRYTCLAKNCVGEDVCSADINVSDKGDNGRAPIFLKKLGDCQINEGENAKFTACITGSPAPDMKWFRNGDQFEFTPRHQVELESNGLLRFHIRNAQPEDFGEYRLSISNPYGSDTCTGRLRSENDTKPLRPLGDTYAGFDAFKDKGVPIPLSEKPRITRMSDGNLTLAWKPSIPIYPRSPVTYQVEHMTHPSGEWSPYRSGIQDSTCDIRGLTPGQDYRYRIRVENKNGISDPSPYTTANRSKLHLPTSPSDFKPKDYEIEHPPLDKNAAAPRFLRKEEDTMYGVKAHPITIEFWVYGYPQPTITWYFNNTLLDTSSKYDFLQDRNGQVMLFLTRMTEEDVGTYRCVAKNEHGEAQKKIQLLIAEQPVFTKRLEETSFMIRRGGRLECRVIGEPYPKIKWFKDWLPLHESSRIKILWDAPDLCTLCLSDSILKDSGLYSCTASNVAGSATTSCMLTIEESETEYDLLTYSRPRVVKPRNKLFEEHYDLGTELGRGTQGVTYHAVERATGKSYASKIMKGPSKMKDFMASEMDILNQLNHPRLLRLWDAFQTKSSMSLITDLCGGGELLDHIINKGTLTESEVAHYMKQVLEGLNHMHEKNIGHLGLTVGDILLTRLHGDNLKLADFGLAAQLHHGRNYIQLYGHPEFVAPELVKKEPASLSADMWSVGVITYLLLSGISPFLGANDRETLTYVQEGKINFFHDAFAEVSDNARDFISKLLVFDPKGRLNVKAALNHPWLKLSEIPDKGDSLNNLDRLKEYYGRWKDWYANASCRNCYRRRPMESCFTHPSKMIYPPGECYTPDDSPEKELNRTKPKESAFDDTFAQKINREIIDVRSESLYQNGPDTYLLQLRDPDYPRRVRQYLRVGASRSPSLASNLKEAHWGNSHVAVRERRRFLDVMDEEIDDEKKGLQTRSVPMRLSHETGTMGYAHEQIESLKNEAWKGRGTEREKAIGSAPFFRERIVDVVIREGQECVFSCLAIGNPKPNCSWFRNDGILVMSSRVSVKETSTGRSQLRLNPGKVYDVGVYKCVARNNHGLAVCRARLKIGDVPGKPEAPEISQCSGTEIYTVWGSPRSNGNSHILAYTLQYKKLDDNEWLTVGENIEHEFFVVKELSHSTLYHFRVAALNKFGLGAFSNPSQQAGTYGPENQNKIRISRARKFQQAATDRSKEAGTMTLEEEEVEELTYDKEQNPVELLEGGETTDHYNFVAEISRGRYSMVIKSWVKEQGETLATKVILTTNENESSVLREFEIMKSLSHVHIVKLHFASHHENLTVLAMERLSGVDVLTYLASKHQYNEETVAKIITQTLEAIDYLHHRGIVYVELQPDNVVLVRQRELNVKLVDFGAAHYLPKSGGKIDLHDGTTEFLAPEVLKKEEINAACDVWGVAVLAYILLSGVSPFAGETEQETFENVSYVRYRFENLHKEVTQEATRFLMHIFKRTPNKRPTVDECLEHKWLLPSEFLLKKREHAVFLAHKLHKFSEQYHAQKQASCPPKLMSNFGMSLGRSISMENDTFEEV